MEEADEEFDVDLDEEDVTAFDEDDFEDLFISAKENEKFEAPLFALKTPLYSLGITKVSRKE